MVCGKTVRGGKRFQKSLNKAEIWAMNLIDSQRVVKGVEAPDYG